MKKIPSILYTFSVVTLLVGCQNLQSSQHEPPPSARPVAGISQNQYARAYADVSVVLAKYGRKYCNWTDGQDYTLGADSGRGVSSWKDHYNYVASPAGVPNNVVAFIAGRMSALQSCLTQDQYARAYADVSVILAMYGRKYCNWTDGQDYSLGADSGRGVSSWKDHYNYVAAPAVIPNNVVEFISGRMTALQNSIKRANSHQNSKDQFL